MDGDLSSLNQIAMALLKLQAVFGVIPNIRSKGLGAKKVLQKLFKLRIEEDANGGPELMGSKAPQQQTRHDIDTLVMLEISNFIYMI